MITGKVIEVVSVETTALRSLSTRSRYDVRVERTAVAIDAELARAIERDTLARSVRRRSPSFRGPRDRPIHLDVPVAWRGGARRVARLSRAMTRRVLPRRTQEDGQEQLASGGETVLDRARAVKSSDQSGNERQCADANCDQSHKLGRAHRAARVVSVSRNE
jgi:hypothetical protein